MDSKDTNFTTPTNSIDPIVLDRRRVLAYIFLLAISVRIVHLLSLRFAPFFEFKIGDSAKYDLWAQEIARGNWFGDEVFYQAPLYPYFLAAIYRTIGPSVFAVRLVQALLGALSCSILAAAVWNLFDRKSAIAAGVIISLYAPSIFLESLIQKSILDLFFMCLILWLVSRIVIDRKGTLWLMLGASVGGLCLTRENAIVFIPLLATWCVLRQLRIKPSAYDSSFPMQFRFAHLSAFIVGLCLILGPVALRNYCIGGEFHITTSQLGPNFYIGNNPSADGYYHPLKFGRGDASFEQADAVAMAETEVGRQLTPGEVSNHYLNKSIAFIFQQPFDWLALLGKKTLLSCNSTEIIDTEDQYVFQYYSPILMLTGIAFHFGLLFPIGLIGMWRSRDQWPTMWPIYLMFALLQATLIGFFIFGRYRFPVVPVLIVFAAPIVACTFESMRARLSTTSNVLPGHFVRGQVAITAVFLTLLVICNLPLVEKNVAASTTYNNFAIQAIMRRDYDLAESFVRTSLDANPRFSLAYNSLGVLQRERGEYASTESNFEKAIGLSPQYANAIKNLDKLRLLKGTQMNIEHRTRNIE